MYSLWFNHPEHGFYLSSCYLHEEKHESMTFKIKGLQFGKCIFIIAHPLDPLNKRSALQLLSHMRMWIYIRLVNVKYLHTHTHTREQRNALVLHPQSSPCCDCVNPVNPLDICSSSPVSPPHPTPSASWATVPSAGGEGQPTWHGVAVERHHCPHVPVADRPQHPPPHPASCCRSPAEHHGWKRSGRVMDKCIDYRKIYKL